MTYPSVLFGKFDVLDAFGGCGLGGGSSFVGTFALDCFKRELIDKPV